MYLGGKKQMAKQVALILRGAAEGKTIYAEPFMGSGAVLEETHGWGMERIAGDLHADLIMMWDALQWGWIPPSIVTEAEYALQKNGAASELRGFVGFACSFGGKFFGGMARDKNSPRNYAAGGARVVQKAALKMQDVEFYCGSYAGLDVQNALIYCDPPYAGTTEYSGERFDSAAFWEWCRQQEAKGNTVIVSEYEAPSDFECIAEIERARGLDSPKAGAVKVKRIERMFRLRRKGGIDEA